MTISVYCQCETCGSVFNLKLQMDNTIYQHDWKIVVDCPECGDTHELVYSTKGLLPKQNREKLEQQENGYFIGFCSTLPTVDSLYYKPYDKGGLPALSSIWINLSDSIPYLDRHTQIMKRITEFLLPYCRFFQFTLPDANAFMAISFHHLKVIGLASRLMELSIICCFSLICLEWLCFTNTVSTRAFVLFLL